VTWSLILFRGDYKCVFSEHISLRGLITTSLTPFIRKLFYQWHDSLPCFQDDKEIILNLKEFLNLQDFGVSSFENNLSSVIREGLMDKCRSFTTRGFSGDIQEERTTLDFDKSFGFNYLIEEGKSKLNHNLKVYIELYNLKSDAEVCIYERNSKGPVPKVLSKEYASISTRKVSVNDLSTDDETQDLYTRVSNRRLEEKNRMLPYLLYDFKSADGEIDTLKGVICCLQRISERFTQLSTVEQLNEIGVVKVTLKSLRHVAQLAFGKLSEEDATLLRRTNYTKYRCYVAKRREVQDQFVTIGVVEMALSLLSLRQPHISKQCLKLLCFLLEAGNTVCQTRFFKIVSQTPNPQFMSYVHSFIQNSKDLLNDQTLTSTDLVSDRINIKVLTLIFRVLQLLCEGHNNVAQTYLLRQVEKTQEFNIVNTTLSFWKEMIDPRKKDLFQTENFYPLNIQLLKTIIEYSQGCTEVQNELFERNVVDYIVHVFNFENFEKIDGQYDFDKVKIYNPHNLKLSAGILLLSLLEGAKGGPGDQIATEICSDDHKLNSIEQQLIIYDLDMNVNFFIDCGFGFQYIKWEITKSLRNVIASFFYDDFEVHNIERELGFTFYCILLHLKPHLPPTYLMDFWSEKSNYYSAFVKCIEIVRPIQNMKVLERVFFLLPCSSHYLMKKVKLFVRHDINRSSMKMKLEDFLLSADKLVLHIKNQKLVENKMPLFRIVNEDVCWISAYVVIVTLNAKLLSSDFSVDDLSMIYCILWSILTLMYFFRHVMVKFKIAQYERKRRESKGQRFKQQLKDNRNEFVEMFDNDRLSRIIRMLVEPSSNRLTNIICHYLLRKAISLPAVKSNGLRFTMRKMAMDFCLDCAEHGFIEATSRMGIKVSARFIAMAKELNLRRKTKHENKTNPGSTTYFYLSLLCIPFTDIGFLYHIFILILVMIAQSSGDKKWYVLFGFPLLDIVYRIDILRDILKAVARSGILTVHVEKCDSKCLQ
jgi:hypothetical protein